MTIIINNLTLTLADTADYCYRSHINGMACTNPDNWVACGATDAEGNNYTCWYQIDDTSVESLDSIDYYEPDDITDEDGRIIYDKEEN